MEYIIKDKTETNRLPEAGELWMHGCTRSIVYMRINDEDGRRARHSGSPEGSLFFSVNMNNGKVTSTGKNAHDIIILEPVGGTLELQAK